MSAGSPHGGESIHFDVVSTRQCGEPKDLHTPKGLLWPTMAPGVLV